MKLHVLLLPALLSLAQGLPAGPTFKLSSAPVRNQPAASIRKELINPPGKTAHRALTDQSAANSVRTRPIDPPFTQGRAPAGQSVSSRNQATTSRLNNPPDTQGRTRLPTIPALGTQNNAGTSLVRPDPGAHKDPGEYSESIKNKVYIPSY